MKPELTVKMRVKGVEIELTVEELRGLRDAIDELTGKIAVKEYIPHPINPWPYPYVHWKTETTIPYDTGYPYPIITCSIGNTVQLTASVV